MLFPLTLPRFSLPEASSLDDRADSLEQRLANGERAAVVEAYKLHAGSVRAFARRLVGDDAIAEDLVHEAFIALPGSMKRFRGDASLRTWIVAIAARHAQHHVRSAQRRRLAMGRLGAEPPALAERPDERFERAELAELLTRSLDALPLDQRLAFVLCEVEERSSVEVARMLGERDGTIRARVMLAKKKLREELARAGGER